MKTLKFLPIALFVFSAVLFTSCKKEVEDNLPGDWNMSMTVSFNGLVGEAATGTAKFNEDGTGTTTVEGETDSFTWSSTDETVTMKFDDDEAITMDVITNEKDEQEWKGTMTETVEGLTLTIEITIKLTK